MDNSHPLDRALPRRHRRRRHRDRPASRGSRSGHVDGFHFRHADGTRHRPLGTTAYAWTHQPEELQEQTLRTLAGSPFTKMRMCVFPKSYLYNANEPDDFVFPGSLAEGFDLERFDVEHFRRLEQRIAQLGALGIEADLILFHAYDRWGFADLGPAVDERRCGTSCGAWPPSRTCGGRWRTSTTCCGRKTRQDWERSPRSSARRTRSGISARSTTAARSTTTRPWITHVSMQRVDVYRTAENTDEWRERWGKPVVIDECAYEGDIDQGWGNITGEEMVRRFWEGAVRGGYVGHGETYLDDARRAVVGEGRRTARHSPARIGIPRHAARRVSRRGLDPLPSDWDVPWGGVAGEHLIGYFGFNRPRFRNIMLPEGESTVDVIDTWNMTVERWPAFTRRTVRVDLPGRQFMAVRLRRVDAA